MLRRSGRIILNSKRLKLSESSALGYVFFHSFFSSLYMDEVRQLRTFRSHQVISFVTIPMRGILCRGMPLCRGKIRRGTLSALCIKSVHHMTHSEGVDAIRKAKKAEDFVWF